PRADLRSPRPATHPLHYTLGPAALIASLALANFAKFLTKRPARSLAFASYAAVSFHVFRGFSTSLGTPGHAKGTLTPNTACGSVVTSSSCPLSAAVSIARVCGSFIRLPTPYGPPLQPVLTSQTRDLCCAIFLPSRSA